MECNNCHINKTSQWRKGPDTKPQLCNSCGVRWSRKKTLNITRSYDRRISIAARTLISIKKKYAVAN